MINIFFNQWRMVSLSFIPVSSYSSLLLRLTFVLIAFKLFSSSSFLSAHSFFFSYLSPLKIFIISSIAMLSLSSVWPTFLQHYTSTTVKHNHSSFIPTYQSKSHRLILFVSFMTQGLYIIMAQASFESLPAIYHYHIGSSHLCNFHAAELFADSYRRALFGTLLKVLSLCNVQIHQMC